MTFEEWLATQDKCRPVDWSSMISAYRFWVEIARRAWEASRENMTVEDI